MDNIKQYIQASQKENVWSLGNLVLYDLCKNHPFHKTNEEIIAKIWLIGRSYAASIERRKTNDETINDDFYSDKVAPIIQKSDIDNWINKCRSSKSINDILQVHHNVTNLFNTISGLNKRSLASKYLHFHLPEYFFIYDTRAVKSIGNVLKILGQKRFIIGKTQLEFDKEYSKFFYKCHFVQEHIKEKYGVILNCRQLDNLLIYIDNENIRK